MAKNLVAPVLSLSAATTTAAVPVVADIGEFCRSVTFQVVASAGTTAGAVTFQGSIDGATYVPLTAAAVIGQTGGPTLTNGVLSFTAASTALVSLGSNTSAIRYFQAIVSTNITGGNVTVKIMGA